MSVLADRMVGLRLAHRPEFVLRLAEFALAYGLGEAAALVVQARPHPDAALPTLDVDDGTLQQQFLGGSGARSAWWDGFRSMSRARPTFHGVAGLSNSSEPTWACEMHRDGHFIAGIWRFPELPGSDGRAVPVIADFYCGFFDDFCALVAKVSEHGGIAQRYELTATLLGAPRLHFAKPSDFGGSHVIGAAPLATTNLQWPVLAVEQGSPAWTASGKELGRALAGAYGATPPRAA